MSSLLFSKKLGATLLQQKCFPINTVRAMSMTDKKHSLSRRDLAAVIAEEHELSLAQSERIVKSVFDTIVEKVSDKGTVRIADFGCFDSLHSKARTYRVPATGGTVDKPAVERPRFKAYDSFKKSVNK